MARSLINVLLTLWQIAASGVRVFAVDSLREGVVDLRPLSRSGRVLVLAALGIVAAFLLSLLFSDALRISGPLETLAVATSEARGLTAPVLAVPITLVTITLAWTYMLTGALHMRRSVRWLAYLSFVLFGAQALGSGMTNAAVNSVLNPLGAALTVLVAFVAFVALLIAFAVLPRLRAPLAVEFSVLASLMTLLVLPSAWQTALAGATYQTHVFGAADVLNDALVLTRALLIPFLFISGVEMSNFAQSVSGWAIRSVRKHASRRLVIGLLLTLLIARLAQHAAALIGEPAPWRAWLGALVLFGGLAVIGRLFRQRTLGGNLPFGTIVAWVAAYSAFNVLLFPLMQLATYLLIAFGVISGNIAVVQPLSTSVFSLVDTASDTYGRFSLLLLALAAAALGVALRRRGRHSLGAFALVLAWSAGWRWITRIDQPLGALRWQLEHLDTLLTPGLLALTVYWLARGRLTEARALKLLGLALLAALLNQTSFLDNPFSPLLNVAGVLLIAVGILWNVLTAGGRFLNTDSAAFPRISRALMYFGYVMLTLCVAHWFVVTHSVAQQTVQSDITLVGFEVFGLALVYWLAIARMTPLVGDDLLEAGGDTAPPPA